MPKSTKENSEKILFVVIIISTVLLGFGIVAMQLMGSNSVTTTNPPGSNTSTTQPTTQPVSNFTYEQNFLYNEIFYDCSREIRGEWKDARIGPMGEPGQYFYPADQEEFQKYCRSGAVIEYHAVIDLLQKPDVVEVIDKYDTTQAWIRALNADYIMDNEYINRILPTFSTLYDIHCIIVLHSPEGTRYFIEDGAPDSASHDYVEIEAKEFLAELNNASDEDVTTFWLNLH